ncbi:V-type proton ATPase subunit S1-like [Panonychus citri]|uniref:V-type proton ATPase subunit S1-like n=1 Tax=Panonychus citri TaxID=50023 RepID=UPI0023078414|nr:V-type proton ATPase subunit S1-like [Panonychus citri]
MMIRSSLSCFLFTLVLVQLSISQTPTIEVCSGNILGDKNPNGCLIIIKDCVYLYMEKIEINWKINNVEGSETIMPVVTQPEVKAQCGAESSKSIGYAYPSQFGLTFSKGLTNSTSITFDTIVDVSKANNYWVLANSTVNLKVGNDAGRVFDLRTSEIYAANTFSFHCSQAKINSIRLSSDNSGDYVIVSVKRLQFQPFISRNPNMFFTDNYDCAKWFTISTWMGFLAILLFTVIVATGVYFLSQIRTMDRFENPKAKPISVPTTE